MSGEGIKSTGKANKSQIDASFRTPGMSDDFNFRALAVWIIFMALGDTPSMLRALRMVFSSGGSVSSFLLAAVSTRFCVCHSRFWYSFAQVENLSDADLFSHVLWNENDRVAGILSLGMIHKLLQ